MGSWSDVKKGGRPDRLGLRLDDRFEGDEKRVEFETFGPMDEKDYSDGAEWDALKLGGKKTLEDWRDIDNASITPMLRPVGAPAASTTGSTFVSRSCESLSLFSNFLYSFFHPRIRLKMFFTTV